MAVRIRSAGKKDVGAVAMVHTIARRAYYEAGGVSVALDGQGVSDSDYLDFWFKSLGADGNRAWIAEDPAECVGFLVAGQPFHEDLKKRPVLELISLYLLPKVWGQGIANSLHQCFVQLLMDTSAALEGVLDVWTGNQRGQAFYRRHGWTRTVGLDPARGAAVHRSQAADPIYGPRSGRETERRLSELWATPVLSHSCA